MASALGKKLTESLNKPANGLKPTEIAAGITVYTQSGKAYTVVSVDKKEKYPVLAKSVANGATGRFLLSSLRI